MTHRLSKSRFQTGLQCPKALWLTCNARELADDIGEHQQHIFDTGTAVGELARTAFAGGVLVEQDHTQSAEALEATATLFADPPAAVFEAALQHGGVFVRPDVLARADDGQWDLYEVKSSTRVKPEHITDLAVQLWVLEGAGLRIRRAFLMHLDNTYTYEGGEHDVSTLFTAQDITADVRAWLPEVPRLVEEQLTMVAGPEPDVFIGKHCDAPHTCAFHGYCHAHMPPRPVTALPRASSDLIRSLLQSDILAIEDVPLDHPGLPAPQRELCELVRSGVPHIDGDVSASLATLESPIHFLDFETIMTALPLFPGTRPWQQVPFQWSDHVLLADGTLEHHEFVHEGTDDPRPAFLSTLLDALGDTGSIVVYSPFESSRLAELARAYPAQADRIAGVHARLFDLLQTVKRHVHHPDCLGSASIKAVLPALVPELSYKDLEIGEGGTASLRYLQTVTGAMSEADTARTFAALREYCGLDTLAMVRIFEVLRGS